MKYVLAAGLLLSTTSLHGTLPFTHPRFINISSRHLDHIQGIVQKSITQQDIPGAVILIAQQEKSFYRQALGTRDFDPASGRMTVDTIFNLTSLTKHIATMPSVLLLAERGCLYLDEPVSKYIPAFAHHGKADFSIKQLLLNNHDIAPEDLNCDLEKIYEQPSDALSSNQGFAVLGELVRIVSGQPLDVFAHTNIFSKLGMHDTFFVPQDNHVSRMVQPCPQNNQIILGNTGLFSTAQDLALFCQMLLKHGTYENTRILSNISAELIYSTFACQGYRGDFFSSQATNFSNQTGISLILDRSLQAMLIILSTTQSGDGADMLTRVANIAGSALAKIS